MDKTVLTEIANKLTELSSLVQSLIPNEEKKAPQAKEPEKPKITLEEIRGKLAGYSQAGFTAEIREILKKFGASKLSEIKPELYADVLAEAEKLND